MTKTYLDWVAENTETEWWHDSADRVELDVGLARGAVGVTTNPVLISAAVKKSPALWRAEIDRIGARNLPPEQKAEALMQSVVATVAQELAPRFEASDGQSGWVCAQVSPARASERECMAPMAPRFHAWAPNIAVQDTNVLESDIRQAGLAVVKRAYALYREGAYEAKLLVAALRGSYHLTELAGASLVMSIHPTCQEALVTRDFARETRSDEPIAPEVIARLRQITDFLRAYEPDDMTASEFITFGATQRTLSQFTEVGWKELENAFPA